MLVVPVPALPVGVPPVLSILPVALVPAVELPVPVASPEVVVAPVVDPGAPMVEVEPVVESPGVLVIVLPVPGAPDSAVAGADAGPSV